MLLPRAAASLGLVSLLTIAASGPAHQLGLLRLDTAFTMWSLAAACGLLAILLALPSALTAWRRRSRSAGVLAMLGLVGGIAAAGVAVRWWRILRDVPAALDVSTDPGNPPPFLTLDSPAPDAAAPPHGAQPRGYPDVVPIVIPIPADEAFEEVLALVQEHEWQIADAHPEAGIIEATETTDWFGFKDDVAVRLTAEARGTRIDMRSRSRIATAEAGRNVRRIREFLEDLAGEE